MGEGGDGKGRRGKLKVGLTVVIYGLSFKQKDGLCGL